MNEGIRTKREFMLGQLHFDWGLNNFPSLLNRADCPQGLLSVVFIDWVSLFYAFWMPFVLLFCLYTRLSNTCCLQVHLKHYFCCWFKKIRYYLCFKFLCSGKSLNFKGSINILYSFSCSWANIFYISLTMCLHTALHLIISVCPVFVPSLPLPPWLPLTSYNKCLCQTGVFPFHCHHVLAQSVWFDCFLFIKVGSLPCSIKSLEIIAVVICLYMNWIELNISHLF